IYETLAERTLALAQVARRNSSGSGYNPVLDKFIRPILRDCLAAGIKIVGNFGAANPRAAGHRIAELARELGCGPLKIACVEGDDITDRLSPAGFAQREVGGQVLAGRPEIVAANVYLGAEPIAEALAQGADVVVTGRVADPSLVLGPLLHSFGWS